MSSHDTGFPEWLAHTLDTTPRRPGCYIMKDRLGEVVYVGKAQDLRARLGQYFQPGTSDTRFFVGLLDRVLGSIDVIVAANVKEALLLENELIKRHQPRFNVKLKDDKNFLNIRIGPEHPFPRLQVVRRRKKDGAEYFGPYHSATSIRQTLKVVNRYFQLRTCRDTDFARRTRPCLEHQIGRCPAPCVLPVQPADYQRSVDDVKLFLSGRADALLTRLRGKMSDAAERLEFELAARYRDQISAIDKSLTPQKVVLDETLDIDAIGLYREGETVVVVVLHLAGGVLVGAHPYPMKKTALPEHEIVDGFLAAYYDGARPVPDLVLTPVELAEAEVWGEILSEAKGKKVEVRQPLRGDKRRLVELAEENAKATFAARQKAASDQMDVLEKLRQRLHLTKLPRRIECYDISNIQGTNPVGSMVVAMDGVMTKSEYRTFKVRGQDTPNDFAMMLEVLTRRMKRVEQGEPGPDLILVDGGKGQLKMAEEALVVIGGPAVAQIELASLAKSRLLDEEGHVARGRAKAIARPSSDETDHSPERVFRPGQKNAIVLRQNSDELFLLQRLRDEAHRFAITFHRKLRSKRTIRSALDGVPGIGPSRRTALLTRFGSVAKLRDASLDELTQVPGISHALAARILELLGRTSG
ncbi:MAG: excinuclease ABC subunit UvrC [Myxococcota bacterium]